MALRLKSRSEHPPYDFQILLPEVGMKAPIKGSFRHVVDEFAKIVAANPAQAAKHNWPDYLEGQEDWVDVHNAQRLQASGWSQFTTDGSELYILPPGQKKTLRGGVVVGKLATGASIWRDLFGESGATVEQPLAEKRAEVCVSCPENDIKMGLANWFTSELAGQLLGLFNLMKGKNLVTRQDDKLGVCRACLCPGRAKVWASIDVIKKHTKQETLDKLHKDGPRCWILSESELTKPIASG